MNFSLIITESRRKRNMTQREMAEKLNVSDKTISKWETGVNFPDLKMLNQISKLIGVSVAELLEADDLKVPENVANNDSKLITQFRTQQITAYILFVVSIFSVALGLSVSSLSLIVGILLLATSFILFSYSLITFRAAYVERRNAQNLDRLNNFYSFLFFESIFFVLFFIFMNFYSARGLAPFMLFFFQLVPHLLRIQLLKISNYQIKKDRINIVLLRVYWSLLISGDLLYGLLLTGWVQFARDFITIVFLPTITSFVVFSPILISLVVSRRKSYVSR